MTIDYLSFAALAVGIVAIILLGVLKKKGVDFGIRTIIALVLGLVVGISFRGNVDYVTAIGSVYVRIISALVIPLLFFSIISSISSLNNLKTLKSIGGKSVFWLTFNTLTASILTIAISLGVGVGKNAAIELPTDFQAKEVPTFLDTIVGLFPKNIISHAANNEVVPFILFAILLGIALVSVASRDVKAVEPFKNFIDSGSKIIFEAIGFVIELTPYAVFALITGAASRNTADKLLPLVTVLVVAYVATFIQTFVVEGLLLKVVGGLNPFRFFKGIWPAQTVAFTSQSSIGTLPVTIKQLTKKLGVSEEIASFVAGLGANLGMPGCAGMWPTLLAVFAINALDIPFSVTQYVFLVVLTVIVSIGTVGVPGTATITATAVFAAAGLPLEVIVILTPISSIVDMARTASNITGAATAAVLVAKSEGGLDVEAYNNGGDTKTKVTKESKKEATI